MFACLLNDELDFFLPRFVSLVMVQMTGVVANLFTWGATASAVRKFSCKSTARLALVCRRISASAAASFWLSTAIRTTPAPRSRKASALATVASIFWVLLRHALNSDGFTSTDSDVADMDSVVGLR